MQTYYDKENKVTAPLTTHLQENKRIFQDLFVNCSDVIQKEFTIGKKHPIHVYLAYIDNMADRELIEEDIIKNFLYRLDDVPKEDPFHYIQQHGLRTADFSEIKTMEEVAQAVLCGDTILMIDHADRAFQIASKDFPGRSVSESTMEVTVRGAKDSFVESIGTNKVLIRRRIRDPKLKVEKANIGIRSHTDIALLYLEDVVNPKLCKEIKRRLASFRIDGILDSGMLEQLTESSWYSPFPQFQSTERPDKAASAILDGRIVLLVDNSPFALLLPTTVNSFFQASDDAYSRWQIVSFIRILRYLAAFLAVALPGLYIVITNDQTEMLPTSLALSFAEARHGVPFSIVFEVLLMELAFELLREAGIRLPGPMGNTIGIVGGLIIGDAAVSANLVSPMIVIIVALTAIAAFTVPNEEFVSAFRFTRYGIIFLSAWLGLYGFLIGMVCLLVHLSSLESFGIPYLMPYVASGLNGEKFERDAILRLPIFCLRKRPPFAEKDQRIRLKKTNER